MNIDYYEHDNIRAIDLIEAFNLNFSLGNVIKYICRAGSKPGETKFEALVKAQDYLSREIERIKQTNA